MELAQIVLEQVGMAQLRRLNNIFPGEYGIVVNFYRNYIYCTLVNKLGDFAPMILLLYLPHINVRRIDKAKII